MTIGIAQVGTVFVPVADQDRALEFYVETLGFEKRADFLYGNGGRWVEVAPPASAIALALVGTSEGRSAGSDAAHCGLAADDIEAVHAALSARGVEVDAQIARTGGDRPGPLSFDVTVTDPSCRAKRTDWQWSGRARQAPPLRPGLPTSARV